LNYPVFKNAASWLAPAIIHGILPLVESRYLSNKFY
jgi:hypothetical protein